MGSPAITEHASSSDGAPWPCCRDATTLPMPAIESPVPSADDWAIELSRAGLAAMLLVGLIDFIFDRYQNSESSPALRLLQGADLALIALTLGLTCHAVYRRYWRISISPCAFP